MLIQCIECGYEYSDKAAACPRCGCPTEYTKGMGTDYSENESFDEALEKSNSFDQPEVENKPSRDLKLRDNVQPRETVDWPVDAQKTDVDENGTITRPLTEVLQAGLGDQTTGGEGTHLSNLKFTPKYANGRVVIGGWLVLPVIHLYFNLFLVTLGLLMDIGLQISAREVTLSNIGFWLGEFLAAGYIIFLINEVSRRTKRSKILFIVFYGGNMLISLISYEIGAVIAGLIWIVYLLKSERVAMTFTKDGVPT